MKKFRGLLAMTLALAVVCASFGAITVSAKDFKDVASGHWAQEYVASMADDGIINGYTDGTFKPDNTVTKLEALALVARILGSREEINAGLIEKGKELYAEKLEDYDLSFGTDEICYLLVKGIIFENELSDYFGNGAANEGMKRYEVAILLTKAMGAEQEVKDKVSAVLDYEDTLEIPATARKYVEHVTKAGLMNGMDDGKFAPMNDVNRAQAAAVLYRLRDINGYETFKGVVASYDKDSRTIRFKLEDDENKAFTIIPANVTLRCDGEEIEPSEITVGWEAVVTIKDEMLSMVDFTSTKSEGEVAGRLMSISRASDTTTLKVENITPAGKETVTYKVADEVVVTYNGKEGAVTMLKVGDYVSLTIKSNKIIVIDGETSTKTVKGTITNIDLMDLSVTVKNGDDEATYYLDSNVKVSKNGDASSMEDVMIGDKVTLKLTYNMITNIEATSTKTSDTGIIQSINIAQTPIITIKIGTKVYEYPVARNVVVLLDGKKGTLYDLRINTNAKITLESDSIVKIETSPIADDTDVQGEVVSVNVAYNLIQVKYVDEISGTENVEQVFVKSGAKIISTSSATDKKLKDVQPGQTITAMGSRSSGVFEATTIIIRN